MFPHARSVAFANNGSVRVAGKTKAAAIPRGGLAHIGGGAEPNEDKAVAYTLVQPCGQSVGADPTGGDIGYFRKWSADGWFVNNVVRGYGSAAGTEVVRQAQTALEGCRTYRATDGEHNFLGSVELPRYGGIDASYGYCQKVKPDGGREYISCQALLAKGNLVSSVLVLHGDTQTTNSTGLMLVGAIAAEALVKAA